MVMRSIMVIIKTAKMITMVMVMPLMIMMTTLMVVMVMTARGMLWQFVVTVNK